MKYKVYEIAIGYTQTRTALTTECDTIEEALELARDCYTRSNESPENKQYAHEALQVGMLELQDMKKMTDKDTDNSNYIVMSKVRTHLFDDTHVQLIGLELASLIEN